MLRSIEGREVFRQFLRSEYSEDNLLFWLACEDLKKETDTALVDEKARIIYEDYVSILSPKEVFWSRKRYLHPLQQLQQSFSRVLDLERAHQVMQKIPPPPPHPRMEIRS